jgi:hypothetical protein
VGAAALQGERDFVPLRPRPVTLLAVAHGLPPPGYVWHRKISKQVITRA